MSAAQLCMCVMGLACGIAFNVSAADQPRKPKPAKVEFSGYGILGNRILKRLVRTMQAASLGKLAAFSGAM